jgi:hypothetical protein
MSALETDLTDGFAVEFLEFVQFGECLAGWFLDKNGFARF